MKCHGNTEIERKKNVENNYIEIILKQNTNLGNERYS